MNTAILYIVLIGQALSILIGNEKANHKTIFWPDVAKFALLACVITAICLLYNYFFYRKSASKQNVQKLFFGATANSVLRVIFMIAILFCQFYLSASTTMLAVILAAIIFLTGYIYKQLSKRMLNIKPKLENL